MGQLKKSSHATYIAKYHIVWIPKFRMPILGRSVGKRLREILKGIAKRYGFEIDTMEIMDDHVHLFVSFPPRISIAHAVKIFKGVSSRRLNEEFPEMDNKIWGAPIWARGYFASTVNDRTTSQTIRQYIKNQKREEKQLRLI
jgi:putative transposase